MASNLPPGFKIVEEQIPAPALALNPNVIPDPATLPLVSLPAPPSPGEQVQPVPEVPMAPNGFEYLPPGFRIQKKDRPIMEQIYRNTQIDNRAFMDSIAELLGAPMDVTTWMMRVSGVMGEGTNPLLGSENIKLVFDELNRNPATLEKVRRLIPENASERMTARTSKEVGAGLAVLFPFLTIARAGKVVKTGAELVPKSTASEIGKAVITPFRETPGKAAATELALAGGGGAGASVANELAPGSQAADLTGVVAGSLGPVAAIGAARKVISAGRAVTQPFSSSGLADRTGKALRESATDPESLRRKFNDAERAKFQEQAAEDARGPSPAENVAPETAPQSPRLQTPGATLVRSPEGETIANAIVRLNGEVFVGENHATAIEKAVAKFGEKAFFEADVASGEFLTNTGRVVSGEEAIKIAGTASISRLTSEELPAPTLPPGAVLTKAPVSESGNVPPDFTGPTDVATPGPGTAGQPGQIGKAVARITKADPLDDFSPSTAQETGDPGIAALEQEITNQSPRLAGRISKQQITNDEILRTELDKLAPEVIAPAEAVAQGVQTRVQTIEEALERSVTGARAKVQERIAALEDVPSKSASNKIAREELEAAQVDGRKAETKIYNKVDPDNSSLILTDELVKDVDELVAGVRKANRGSLPEDILTVIGSGGRTGANTLSPEENISEIFAVSSKLGSDIRAARSAGDFGSAKILSDLKSTVDNFIDNVPLKDPGVIDRLAAAKEFSIKLNDTFSRTTVGDVLARKSTGAPRVPESATIEAFFRTGKGSEESVNAFIRAVGEETGAGTGTTRRGFLQGVEGGKVVDKRTSLGTEARPKAIKALKDFAMKDLFETAVREDGTLNSKLAKDWLEKHRPVLRPFPELTEDFGSIFKMQARLDEVLGRQKRTLASVQKGAAKLFLERDPDKAIAAALSDKNPAAAFRSLRNLVKNDKTAVAGLRRSVLDVIKGKAEFKLRLPDGNEVLNPKAIYNFVNKNRRALDAIGYKEADIERMLDIANKANINAGGSSIKSGAKGTKVEKSFLSINQILSRLYGIQRGVVSKRFVIGEVGTRLVSRWINKLNRSDLQFLMEEALANPSFAATISQPVSGKNQEQVLRTLHGHLARNITPDDEEK